MVNCTAVGPKLARERRVTARGCPNGRGQSHKYDRYLADVFLAQPDGQEIFLNNALLSAGHAGRKDEWSASDWEK
jgi:endonuclease YncB( thermonuclease family)